MRYEITTITDYTGKVQYRAGECPVLGELIKLQKGIKFKGREFRGLVVESNDCMTLTLRTRHHICTFVKREKNLSFDSLYGYCVSNNYFTDGSNNQYDKMFSMLNEGFTTREIAIVICLCSPELTMDDVSKVEVDLNEYV